MLVGLDYDGTFAPKVDEPSKSKLSSETREVVMLLSRRPIVSVAIKSGRALDDIQARVGVAGLIHAGNHGLEIHGPGLRFVGPTSHSQAIRQPLATVATMLGCALAEINGAVVENKHLTLSVHFRRVAASRIDDFDGMWKQQ